MAPFQAAAARPRVRAQLWIAIFLGLVLLVLAGALGVGRWLIVEDPLGKADAVVILSGRMPMRAREAAALYREGWAPQVWVTRPAGPGAELGAMGIPYVGEAFYSQRVLIHLGVPADAIRALEPDCANTAAEVDAVWGSGVGQWRLDAGLWRARDERLLGGCLDAVVDSGPAAVGAGAAGMRCIVRAVRDDPYDGAHWWRSSSDALDVVREVLGLANAWAGLPLKPAF